MKNGVTFSSLVMMSNGELLLKIKQSKLFFSKYICIRKITILMDAIKIFLKEKNINLFLD